MKFVRKVYAILACQLTITTSMIAAVQYNDKFRTYAIYNQGMAWACFAGAMTSMCAIVCCLGRKVPHNYILLLIFTLCESYMVAGLTARYEPNLVMTAGLATALVTIALTVYAMYTKVNIEIFYAMVFVIYLAMFPLMIFGFFIRLKALYILYCCLGLVFYSIFLIIDTMQICNSNKSLGGYAVEYDDYIIGALQLYLDIIMIFVYILKILGAARD